MKKTDSAPLTLPTDREVLEVWAGRNVVRFRFSGEKMRAITEKYLAPTLVDRPAPEARAEAIVSERGLKIVFGPAAVLQSGFVPLVQLELLLIDWTLALASSSIALHAGCVLFGKTPIIFVTESGGGKSSLTLAAVRAGASYITDDMLLVCGSSLSGLARSIRFKHVLAELDSRPMYLEHMDCEWWHYEKDGKRFVTPIWTGPCPSLHEFDFSDIPPVVVRVSRGPDELRPLSEMERLITLHEAAILRCGEYDGSLGPGPTYHLSWEDPTEAFALLAEELRARGHVSSE